MTIEETLRKVELKPGMQWLDGQEIMVLEQTNGGHVFHWKAYLMHLVPPTGPMGEGAKVFVHRIDIPGVYGGVSMTDDQRAGLRVHVEAEVKLFHGALESGTAKEIQDGETLP